MTVLVYDLHHRKPLRLSKQRVHAVDFDEVSCADGTMCVGTKTRTLNRLIAQLEQEAAEYALKLNKVSVGLHW